MPLQDRPSVMPVMRWSYGTQPALTSQRLGGRAQAHGDASSCPKANLLAAILCRIETCQQGKSLIALLPQKLGYNVHLQLSASSLKFLLTHAMQYNYVENRACYHRRRSDDC